jgi:transcriptional regulator with XRE-family HTH domain
MNATKTSKTNKRASDSKSGVTANDQEVGTKIKSLRKLLDMSLQEVSAASGVSVGQISQIERGLSSPSVSTLVSLCQALGVTIGSLFNDGVPGMASESKWVVRAGSRKELKGSSETYKKFLLSPSLDGTHQIYQVEFAPLTSSGETEHGYAGESSGVLIEGILELQIDGQLFVLQPGDTFGIPPGAMRLYRNPGPLPVKIIWIISTPGKTTPMLPPNPAFHADLKKL